MNKNKLKEIKLNQEKILPKVGRKKKPTNEVASESVTLKLTKQEMQIIRDKAGLAPLGRFVRYVLTEQTDIFKE